MTCNKYVLFWVWLRCRSQMYFAVIFVGILIFLSIFAANRRQPRSVGEYPRLRLCSMAVGFLQPEFIDFFLANSFGKYESIENGSGGIPANTWLHTLENATICSGGLFHYGSLINWFKKNAFACLMYSSSSLFVCVSFFIETSNWFYCFSSFFPIQFEFVSFDLNEYFCHWGGTFFSVSTLRLNDKNLLNWIFLLRLNNTAYNYYCEWSLYMNIALHSFVHVITGTKSSSVSMETETQSWF